MVLFVVVVMNDKAEQHTPELLGNGKCDDLFA